MHGSSHLLSSRSNYRRKICLALISDQFEPPLIVYSYNPLPPVAPLIVIVPSLAPLHVTIVHETVALNTGGCVISSIGLRTL